ncbi:uncharacterized protein LOC107424225 [Ziziphus jujuba]|uniref:Uncharacterized protein LOC107424225 n=1 Tax=Ziziphus jujuba TaxID=326968 RepID=A0A6P4A331_ZIZJJ|nr:uncharacterized protein LOC107424225 [Ziziphus jujuba]
MKQLPLDEPVLSPLDDLVDLLLESPTDELVDDETRSEVEDQEDKDKEDDDNAWLYEKVEVEGIVNVGNATGSSVRNAKSTDVWQNVDNARQNAGNGFGSFVGSAEGNASRKNVGNGDGSFARSTEGNDTRKNVGNGVGGSFGNAKNGHAVGNCNEGSVGRDEIVNNQAPAFVSKNGNSMGEVN